MSSEQLKKRSTVKYDDYALLSLISFMGLVAFFDGNYVLAASLTVVIDAVVFLVSSKRYVGVLELLRPFIVKVKLILWEKLHGSGGVRIDAMYDVLIGYDEKTGKPIIGNLQSMQSIIFAAVTGFGKTTWLQEWIDGLVNTHKPEHLQLIIGDAKRVSTSVWRNIPHLMMPIAKTPEEHALILRAAVDEMERRQTLFEKYADYFCESLGDYHRLSGDFLPRIVVIIDELRDSVSPGTDAYADLIRLANVARYVGITLVIGTQRPSASVVTGDLLSAMVTKVYGYMPNTREYALVSMIPVESYSKMTATPGRFMLYMSGVWSMMSVKRTSRDKMAQRAGKLSKGHRRDSMKTFEQMRETASDRIKRTLADKTEWSGRMDDKIAMLQAWAATLDHTPRVKEIMERYRIQKPTAIAARKKAFPGEYS